MLMVANQAVSRLHLDTREATDIEKLLQWAIGKQMADLITEAAEHKAEDWLDGGGVSADGCAAVMRFGALGTFVDGSKNYEGLGGLPIHPDAELVYRTARESLDGQSLSLVRFHAQRGTRPVWAPFPIITYEPAEIVWKKKGPQARVRKMPGGAEYCVAAPRDRLRELVAHREQYLWWHRALKHLEYALMAEEQKLVRWKLAFWRLPTRPWERA